MASFLIAVDISCTGVIPHATPREVGHAIHRMKLGSFSQMIKLGLITSNATKADCGDAYHELFCRLDAELNTTEKEAMKFNVCSPEHGLCKMTRLQNFLYLV